MHFLLKGWGGISKMKNCWGGEQDLAGPHWRGGKKLRKATLAICSALCLSIYWSWLCVGASAGVGVGGFLVSQVFSLAASHAAAGLKVEALFSCVYAERISMLHTVKYKWAI